MSNTERETFLSTSLLPNFYILVQKVLKSLSFSLSVRQSGFLLWFCDSVQSFILGLEVTQHKLNSSSLILLGHFTMKSLNVCVSVCEWLWLEVSPFFLNVTASNSPMVVRVIALYFKKNFSLFL